MKSFFLRFTLVILALLALAGCAKDDLDSVDIKMDGSFESSYSVGRSSSGAYGRTRVGIGF
ncbi:MAG: hypothetical protein IKJ34_03580 [Mailhella sp.]|nr:hypothetical protein [Mailhella sp.]